MKVFNNSAVRTSPDFRNASVFLVKPLNQEKKKVGEYGMLQKAVNKQMKKKKKTVNRNLSQRNLYLTGREEWCSLDKLVQMNKEKNQDIKRHIKEKAELQSRNEELKLMMLNPTLRQHDLNQKIFNLQSQVTRLRKQIQQKQMSHREQIQNIREKHLKQINDMRQSFEKNAFQNQNINNYRTNQTYIQNKPQSPVKTISNQVNSATYTYQGNPVSYTQPNRQNQNIESVYTGGYRTINNYNSGQNNNQMSVSSIKYEATPLTRQINRNQERNSNSFVNVFGSSNSNSQTRNLQGTKMETNPSRIHVIKQTQNHQSYSPNSTKNTTGHANTVNTVRYQKGAEQQRSVSPSKQTEYRNVINYSNKVKIQQKNARPVSFAGESGVAVTVNKIDDIYKRYCLND